MVAPALCLHDEQVKWRHDGYIVDLRHVGREDRREVDGAGDGCVDVDAAMLGMPAGKMAY